MKTPSIHLLFFLLPLLARADTVTFDGVVPSGANTGLVSISLSADGVNAQGATTYIEEQVITVALLEDGTSTITSAIPAQTLLGTIVEGASGYTFSRIPTTLGDSGDIEACSFGADGTGSCQDQIWISGQTETITTSFTGPVFPVATLTASPPTNTKSSASYGVHSAVVAPVLLTLSGFSGFFTFL